MESHCLKFCCLANECSLIMIKEFFSPRNFLNYLLFAIPVAIFLELKHANPVGIFVASALAIVPLAGLMGKATEHLAESLGEGVGGLLNATFGNAAELIIALMGLRAGLYGVVKASITGSIIGNILLVLGLSILAGGLKHSKQKFNQTAAGMGATLLTLSAIGLIIPAIFHFLVKSHPEVAEQNLSLEISIVLFIVYILSLIFSLRTHSHLYVSESGGDRADEDEALGVHEWSKTKSVTILLIATALVALMSEFLVGAVEAAAKSIGLTEVFVGVILVAIIGNAAEHSTAVLMAMKNKMDLALNIAIGSSLQIALFVAPLLVFSSYLIAGKPMDLLFTPMEVLSIAISASVAALIVQDGESNWMEGVLLIAVYTMLGITFYFLPA